MVSNLNNGELDSGSFYYKIGCKYIRQILNF